MCVEDAVGGVGIFSSSVCLRCSPAFSGFAPSMTYGTKAVFGELDMVGGVCVRWALESAGVSCETV